jgi:hypothetical protein
VVPDWARSRAEWPRASCHPRRSEVSDVGGMRRVSAPRPGRWSALALPGSRVLASIPKRLAASSISARLGELYRLLVAAGAEDVAPEPLVDVADVGVREPAGEVDSGLAEEGHVVHAPEDGTAGGLAENDARRVQAAERPRPQAPPAPPPALAPGRSEERERMAEVATCGRYLWRFGTRVRVRPHGRAVAGVIRGQ